MDTTSSSTSAFPYLQQQSQEAVPNSQGVVASSSSTTSSGSIGPFFAVIFVLTVLAIISCFIGRICKGRSVTPLESIKHAGFLGWLRRKCYLYGANDAQVLPNKATASRTANDDGDAQDAV